MRQSRVLSLNSNAKMAEKVCRLCLSTEDLMSVFDSKMVEDMPEIIRTTTGVEVST